MIKQRIKVVAVALSIVVLAAVFMAISNNLIAFVKP